MSETAQQLLCPDCNEPIWDFAFGSKLNKCWNCGLAFDCDEVSE